MTVLIYIEITESPSEIYEKPFLNWLRNTYPDLTVFDFDNHSDPSLFAYAKQVIEKEEKIILVIDSERSIPAPYILPIMEKIVKHKEKCFLLLKGEHESIERMGKFLGEKFVKVNDSSTLETKIMTLL